MLVYIGSVSFIRIQVNVCRRKVGNGNRYCAVIGQRHEFSLKNVTDQPTKMVQ